MGSFESKPHMMPFDKIENDDTEYVQELINNNININDLTVNFHGTEFSLIEFVVDEKYNNIFQFMLNNNYDINAALTRRDIFVERIQTNMNNVSLAMMQVLGFNTMNNHLMILRCPSTA